MKFFLSGSAAMTALIGSLEYSTFYCTNVFTVTEWWDKIQFYTEMIKMNRPVHKSGHIIAWLRS